MLSLLLATLLTGTALADDDEVSPLRPDEEVENYTKHPVNHDKTVFKPGAGLVFESNDGMFSLALGLRAMYLYELDHDATPDPGEDPTTQEIMIRRARVTFGGKMWGEKNTYKIELAISPRDESVDDTGYLRQTPLLTWINRFEVARELVITVGQYKIPYNRERVISSSKLAMVDRSRANSAFNLDRDIGLDIGSGDVGGADLLQYNVGIYAGEGRGRFEPNDFGMMYLARVNLTPGGSFDDYEPQDFDRTGPRFSIGAAYAFVDSPNGAKSILDGAPAVAVYDYHNATADLVFKAYGFSTLAAFYWRDGGDPFSEFAETGIGFMAEPGYLIPKTPVGLVFRFDQVIPEPDSALSEKTEIGPALSWYMFGARNKMKLQTDYLRSWGDDPSDGEDKFRVQLQAML